jgi:replication-associated recombination protein RarA
MKRIGYGAGYRYVHDDTSAKEEMQCLPAKLADRVYYTAEENRETIGSSDGEKEGA